MSDKIYSVSYLATKNDNGHCVSFTTREEAEKEAKALRESGCYHVSAVWVR